MVIGGWIMELIWISYFKTLLFIIFSFKCIKILYDYFFKRIYIIKIENAVPKKQKIVEKHLKLFNTIAIFFIILFILITIITSYDHALELPNIFSGKTTNMYAITISSSLHNNITKERSIEFKNIDTNEKIILKLVSDPIKKGECMKIKYFSHIKIGFIVDRNNCYNNYTN